MNSRRFITLPIYAEFGFQLRLSKQESAPSETGGRCGNVRSAGMSAAGNDGCILTLDEMDAAMQELVR